MALPPRWARKVVEVRRLLLVAVPVGMLTGVGVAALEWTCTGLLWDRFAGLPLAARLAIPTVGLLLSGVILARLKVQSIGLLNEVVVHYHAPPERMALEDDVLKATACVATVGFGASAGLGGPSQWLGTRIALYARHLFARRRPLRGISRIEMLLLGGAAGVGAYFRAPFTGTLLALETPFSRDIDGTALLPASVAALLAHLTHGWLVDNRPLLPFPADAPPGPRAVLGALAIGVLAGLLSRRFQRVLVRVRQWTGPWPMHWRALAGGSVTALSAYLAWRCYGDTWTLQGGLPLSVAMFAGQFNGWAALGLLALKFIAVWAAFGTTGVAGILVVTLCVGTLLGGVLHPLLPGFTVAQACAVAVCAYLAANYNAPLTGIALAAEWGGTGLLSLVWVAVLPAVWIGEGLANTPAKAGHRHPHRIQHH
jgi:CIC family chloride channel protein